VYEKLEDTKWPQAINYRTDNTMAKRKRTDNTMAKRKGTNGQTTQWPKEKGPMDKQRSTKHYTEN
jgi:hypothetical protein